MKGLEAKDWIGFGYTTIALVISLASYLATIAARRPNLLLLPRMANEDVNSRPVAALTLDIVNVGMVAVSVIDAGIRCSYGTEIHKPKYSQNDIVCPCKILPGERVGLKYLDNQAYAGETLETSIEFVVKLATGNEMTTGRAEIAAWLIESQRLHLAKD